MKKVKLLCSLFAAFLLSGSMWAANVAKIGSTEYATLADAITAASAGQTITMIAEVNFGDYGATALTIPSGKDITIDLNGQQITGNTTLEATSQMILNQGSLTIKDSSSPSVGRIMSGANPTWQYGDNYNFIGSYASNTIRNEGLIIVESGTIMNAASGSAAYAVDNYNNTCQLVIKGGKLETAFASATRMFYNDGSIEISGGELISGQRYALQLMGKEPTVSITGGTFQSNCSSAGNKYAIANFSTVDAEININGGTFKDPVYFAAGDDVTIKGGTFEGAIEEQNTSTRIEISGGTYTVAPDSKYIAEDFELKQDPQTGKYSVKATYVAQIGSTKYETLEAAVAAAEDGETIVMIANADQTAQVVIDGKVITLDLNGKKIEYVGTELLKSGVIGIHNGASLTINDSSDPDAGSIVAGSKAYSAVMMTLKNDAATNPATLVVNGGNLIGYYYAIGGNGSRHNTSVTINGGVLTATCDNDNYGIFQPQNGILTVNGGTITAYSAAIELRAGTLVITDGALTATSSSFSCDAAASGSTTVGAAIAIAQHTTQVDMNITISGGTFSGVKALNESNPQGNVPDPQVALAISGGKFAGEIATADVQKFISGGIYSVEPADAYIAENYQKIENPDEETKVAYPWAVGVATSLTEIRDVVEDGFATICWAKELVAGSIQNAEVYSIIDKDASGNIVLEQVTENLVAGKPYIVKGTADGKMKAQETGVAAAEASNDNGLYGSLVANYNITADAADKYAFIANDNKYYTIQNGGTLTVATNRAYIRLDQINAQTPAPGRKSIKLQTGDVNTTTELMNVNAKANVNGKMILNGKFVIVKDGKIFNAQGAQL